LVRVTIDKSFDAGGTGPGTPWRPTSPIVYTPSVQKNMQF
jgi:hypothetical protein